MNFQPFVQYVTGKLPTRPELGRAWIVYMMFNRSLNRSGLADVVVVAHGAVVVAQDAPIDRLNPASELLFNRFYSILFMASAAAVLQCILIYLIMAEGGFYFKDVFFLNHNPEKQVRMGLFILKMSLEVRYIYVIITEFLSIFY